MADALAPLPSATLRAALRQCLGLGLLLGLGACGGGGGSDTAATPEKTAAAAHVPRFVAVAEPAGSHCAHGGMRVSAGLDADTDDVLDASEGSSVQFVCNGAPGAAGASGASGSAGINSLVRAVSEPPGTPCPSRWNPLHCRHGQQRQRRAGRQ